VLELKHALDKVSSQKPHVSISIPYRYQQPLSL
jgi:hypothetical protein